MEVQVLSRPPKIAMQSEKYIPEAAKNFKAPTPEATSNPEGEFSPTIPRGWTILKHGTNLARWGESNPYNTDEITVARPLSVITQEEYDTNVREHGGRYNTTDGYASMTGPKGEVLEKIGQTQEGGRDIFYFLPHSVAEAYRTESEAK